MIVCTVVTELTDGVRLERAVTLAELAIGRYGLRDARLRPGATAASKQVLLAESPTRGRFVLKTYGVPPEAGEGERSDPRYRTERGLRSPETLRAQLLWLSALRNETDLAVPEPVPLPDGSLGGGVSFADLPPLRSLLRRVSARHRDLYPPNHPSRHFALLRWVPGENKKGLTAADLSRVGRLAAGLHDHAARYRPPDASALPHWDWNWPFGASAPLWKDGEEFYSAREMEVFGEAARRVREDLALLGHGIEVFGPILRDLTLGNLLFGARTGRVGVMDFDQCGLGHHLFDLSVVLRSLLRSWRRAGRPEGTLERAQEALIGGYADVRGLPLDHDRLLRAFEVMQRTAAVNRTLRLRSSETTQGRSCRDAFLRQFVVWLERGYLA